ncbi:MAG TPA: DUF4118 domain-containing protein [Clostridiales bacterium]|nr:DUF4118 domain-containing protein [Clostridiales bacterium]
MKITRNQKYAALSRLPSPIRDAAVTLVIPAAVTGISLLVSRWSGSNDNIGVIYVLAVVLVSRFTSGYLWGIIASVLGVFGTNYFFTVPYHTLEFSSGYSITFFSMLVVSLMTSTATVRLREHARLALLREKRTDNLYEFSQKLLSAGGIDSIVSLTLEYLFRTLKRSVIFYTEDPAAGGRGTLKTTCDRDALTLCSMDEQEAAHQAFVTGVRTGAGTKICPKAAACYFPVAAHGCMLGAVGFLVTQDGEPAVNILTFLEMLISQTALALERQRLSEKQQAAVVEAEKEKMRTNLLRSVSHDLRTPLTSIIGASSAILENPERIDPQTRNRLISDIHQEAQWLIRMVENLLTVTRIHSAPARLKKQPEAVEEIAAESVTRLKKRFPGAAVHVSVPEEFLMVPMDATLIEQVLINLLENAVRHAGATQPIELQVGVEQKNAVFEVRDRGKGLSETLLPHIFDGYPSDNSDSTRGSGVGLSICKSIVRAHGGTITAANRPDGGAVFTFTLPLEEANSHDE